MHHNGTLVARAKTGNYDAFEQLVCRHERRVYALAMQLVQQREDAEDVVQTTFLSALEHLAEFRQEASFATWVTRIAINTALKILRKRQGLDRVSLDQATAEDEEGEIRHPEYIADWRDDPAKAVERRELQRILAEAMDVLPEKHRTVFVLRDVVGQNVNETAKMLGISTANVKVRLLRARLALRETLTRAFGDEHTRALRTHRHAGDERHTTPAQQLLRSYQEQ
jgi:RNA polymerase sigma-70 factor (ECF subfamily)